VRPSPSLKPTRYGRFCKHGQRVAGAVVLAGQAVGYFENVHGVTSNRDYRKAVDRRSATDLVVIPGTHRVQGYPKPHERNGRRRGQAVKAAQHPQGLAFTDWHRWRILAGWEGGVWGIEVICVYMPVTYWRLCGGR
jgi:hypothetical protein